MNIMLRNKVPTRATPAPVSTLIYLTGSVLVTLSTLFQDTTWLQTAIGFFGAMLAHSLGVSLTIILVFGLTILTIFRVCRMHFRDWLVILLVTVWTGCNICAYLVGGINRIFFSMSSVFVFLFIALIIVFPLSAHKRDGARSLLVAIWLGMFLWAYNFAPNHYSF